MSETTADGADQGTEGEGQQQEQTQPKPTETVDFWKQKAREQESRAKSNAAAAKRLAEIEEAQKTEAEKTADRLAKADAEVASVPSKVADGIRDHLIKLHDIDAEDAELFLTASDPDLLLKQVTRLIGQQGAGKKKNQVSREGTNTNNADSDEVAFVRDLFGG